jgi:succinate dehydrogenase / fumarate reductase flavoprotein subunit
VNKNLEYAGRVADYLEFAGVAGARRAAPARSRAAATSARRARRPTAKRCVTTPNFTYAAAWEFKGVGVQPELHKEPLHFEYVKPSQRSYK